ncbi:MAG: hypothetical protein ACRBHB_09545 [Arenicella sp.]
MMPKIFLLLILLILSNAAVEVMAQTGISRNFYQACDGNSKECGQNDNNSFDLTFVSGRGQATLEYQLSSAPQLRHCASMTLRVTMGQQTILQQSQQLGRYEYNQDSKNYEFKDGVARVRTDFTIPNQGIHTVSLHATAQDNGCAQGIAMRRWAGKITLTLPDAMGGGCANSYRPESGIIIRQATVNSSICGTGGLFYTAGLPSGPICTTGSQFSSIPGGYLPVGTRQQPNCGNATFPNNAYVYRFIEGNILDNNATTPEFAEVCLGNGDRVPAGMVITGFVPRTSVPNDRRCPHNADKIARVRLPGHMPVNVGAGGSEEIRDKVCFTSRAPIQLPFQMDGDPYVDNQFRCAENGGAGQVVNIRLQP